MEAVEVSIQGISPLLMHSFPIVPIEKLEKKSADEQAVLALYRDESGEPYVPAIAVQRSLVDAALYSVGKGRASLQKPVAACALVSPERLPLEPNTWIVDARPVVIPSTQGRIVRYRPRFDKWSTRFLLEWDLNLVSEEQLRKVVDDAGHRIGLMDFRPARKGMFGRFHVTGWHRL